MRSNPELTDTENPEWSGEMVAQAVRLDALPPSLQTKLRRGRGPARAPTKQQVTLRLDSDVLAAFKAGGKGWQTRLNDTLRAAVLKD